MATISLCMIVKNEEEVLGNCLDSVKEAVDEIVIVDTGSTDKTKEIAGNYTNKVFNFEWIDDFSAARNFAFSKATMDFILWLDADDVLLEKDLKKLLGLKKELNDKIDGVSMLYNIAFDEFENPTFYYRRNRLVNRKNQFKWHGVVHEYLEVFGNILRSDIAVTHKKHEKRTSNVKGDRNLKIYERKMKRGEPFSPRDLYYYANELRDNQLFKKAASYYQEFLATKKGWVEDEIMACLSLADCYRQLGEKEKELDSLCKSFQYDLPRPEICCRLGDFFKNNKAYESAIFWYNTAIDMKPKDNGGFQKPAYFTWYPHLQLVVCYWELGNAEKSYEHNKLAEKFIPNDSSVLLNKQFFNDYFGEKKEEKEKKKILYIGWIGHKNLGDDLMWELFSEYFEEKFGKQDWELHGTLRKPAKEFDLDTFDLIVLGGGSIICKDHIPFLHRAVEKGKKVMIWGSGIDLINKKDVPLLEAGKKINVQDYYSINLQEKLNEVIEQAEFFGVRGPLTYEIIKQMGANEKKVMICGDPAFLLTSRSNIDKEAKEAILPFKGNKIIGVNWGTSYNYLYGGNEGAVENQLAEALKALIQKGYKVYLYTVWDQDIPSVKQLYKKINDQQNVIIDTNLHDKNFLIDLLSHFHFTINFKLHANYLSLGAETPPIPLAYRFKVIDFAQSIDLDRFIISTDSKTIKDEILKHESTINLERESIVGKMKNKKAEYMNLISEPFTKNLYFNDVEKG